MTPAAPAVRFAPANRLGMAPPRGAGGVPMRLRRMAWWCLSCMAALALTSRANAEASAQTTTYPALQEGERTLRIATHEGTWMSVDATPDGKSMLFDLLGEVYALPSSGGTAEPVITGLPYDSQPRVSPDGQWIAFISDRDGADNLWVLKRADGSLRQLSANKHTVSISPAWGADSQRLLVAETLSYRADSRLRVYSLSGADPVELVDDGGKPVIGVGAVFSPDGRYVYFAQASAEDEASYRMPITQIRRMDLRTRHIETLTAGAGGGTRPLVSPDGRLLIYASRREGRTGLRARDLPTGADRELLWPVQQDRQDYARAMRGDYLPGYSFTPDGRALLMSFDGKLHRVSIPDGNVTSLPFSADVSLELGPRLHRPFRIGDGPVEARIVHHPSFAPDGRRIAMSVLTRLYVMDARPGAVPRRLTHDTRLEFQPVWSPDGRWISYVVWSPSEGGHIWTTRSDGRGEPRRLTTDAAYYTDLAYSTDGRRILAMRANHRLYSQDPEDSTLRVPLDLVWVPSSGGTARVIAPSFASHHPHECDDSGRIYGSDGHSLVSVRYDGTDLRRHLTLTGRFNDTDNAQPVAERLYMRPGCGEALALINKQVWRLSVPPYDERSPAVVDVRSPASGARRLTDVGADFLGWTDHGRSIAWAIGSTVHRMPAAEASNPATARTESFRAVVQVPRAIPAGSVLLRGATLVTPSTASADAHVLENADILVTGNRITSVGPRGHARIPRDAKIRDLSGQFIVPGYIDTHAHWRYAGPDIQDPDNWSLRANLAYGVTSGLDVQSNHAENFIYQDLVDAGRTRGTRAFMVGPGIFGVNDYKSFEADFQSYEETLGYLRRYGEHYRTHNVKAYLAGDRRQRQWIVKACAALGLMPTTEGFGDPVLHITHAIDGMHGNEHAMLDSPFYQDVVTLLAGTRTSYTPTLTITHYGLAGFEYFLARNEVREDPKLNRFYPRERLLELASRRSVWGAPGEFAITVMAQQAAKVQRADGLVGVGSHGEVQGLGYHWELQMLAMGGLRPAEILRAATIDGARIIGIEQDAGSIEPGKLADMVVLAADPLADIRNASAIRYVMQNGVLYDGERLELLEPPPTLR